MSSDIYNINWLDIIPPSISGDPQVQAISAAVTPELQQVSQSIRECIILARLDELEESVVDLLAWQYHVDFYDAALPIDQKRNLVRTSIDAHRHKGTPYAVELVVKAILKDAIVQEWFDYGGEPYYFRVVKIGGDMVQPEVYTKLKTAINMVKNTRSWLDGVSLYREMSSNIYYGFSQSIHQKIDLYPSAFKMPNVETGQYMGGLISLHNKIELTG
ncbi:phage tail P2-like protein [Sporomusaceae bacterium BoRhaA]|uniref:phage tail protein I n=1 Tax=Pelorhabdus rhamnosifermentans TaxID=2772457 RepID=UPI001C063EEC|nr:phage tail protein I [Pelorhabdus rhamnosifermentans]MBU2701696.1 phage tail P2-like protein [Pelorhabdus rhamnosifermentans]